MTISSSSLRSSVQLSEEWLTEIREHLDTDDDTALGALRGTLQVPRDSLTSEEAVHLGSQLPTVIRGVYYTGWDPSKVPVRRNTASFLEMVRDWSGLGADGPHPLAAARAVMHVLNKHISSGEMDDVFAQLPAELTGTLMPETSQ